MKPPFKRLPRKLKKQVKKSGQPIGFTLLDIASSRPSQHENSFFEKLLESLGHPINKDRVTIFEPHRCTSLEAVKAMAGNAYLRSSRDLFIRKTSAVGPTLTCLANLIRWEAS